MGEMFTRGELAERADVSVAVIERLEYGISRRPRRLTLEKIAKGLDVPIERLLFGVEDSDPKVDPSPTASELGVSEGSPDPRFWGPDSERPDPVAEGIPAPSGHRIGVKVEDGAGPVSLVTITRDSFLELLRKVKRGEITPEDAATEAERMSAA
jgi:hypothetical protein